MTLLEIKNLVVTIENKEILKGVSLKINKGENHALVGPNGNGKSTLLKVIMGHPSYAVKNGTIKWNGENLLDMEVEERSKAGIFLAQQYPSSVPGIRNSEFLKTAMNSHTKKPLSILDFRKKLAAESRSLNIQEEQNDRYLNVGFSGGEKKKNEILQLKLLKPKLALVDEIDSGLDVDALKLVSKTLFDQVKQGLTLLTVSHYERLYSVLKPTHVHIIIDGKIIKTGGYEIIKKIDKEGYNWIKNSNQLDLGDL